MSTSWLSLSCPSALIVVLSQSETHVGVSYRYGLDTGDSCCRLPPSAGIAIPYS